MRQRGRHERLLLLLLDCVAADGEGTEVVVVVLGLVAAGCCGAEVLWCGGQAAEGRDLTSRVQETA